MKAVAWLDFSVFHSAQALGNVGLKVNTNPENALTNFELG